MTTIKKLETFFEMGRPDLLCNKIFIVYLFLIIYYYLIKNNLIQQLLFFHKSFIIDNFEEMPKLKR